MRVFFSGMLLPFVLFLFLLLSSNTSLQAQSASLSGHVADNTNTPLIGAAISLLRPSDSLLVAGTTADLQGNFQIQNIREGNYIVHVSYLGYKDQYQVINMGNSPKSLGNIQLKTLSTKLNGVTIEEKIPLAQQKGDTTEYNANAYKVNKDASAEDLVTKMPGIVMKDGKAYAQGEEVKKVLVDGKEFFGDDASIALKNLPAEVIDKIQVYDKPSDQAQFTGFKDNNSEKTLNIQTKSGKSNGLFGKLYAGYGTDDRYNAGGNLNYFNGNRRISIIGMSNNINQQNFSSQDVLGLSTTTSNSNRGGGMGGPGGGGPPGGGPMPAQGSSNNMLTGQNNGINTTSSLGLNYIDTWGKKWKVNGSYFFNNTQNTTSSETRRQYFLTDTTNQYYNENSESSSNNQNHRINLRMEYTIDTMNSILFTPTLSYQKNSSDKLITGQTLNTSRSLLNDLSTTTHNTTEGYTASGSLLYRHRFLKKGRTFSINVNTSYSDKSANSSLYSNTYSAILDSANITNQKANGNTQGYTVGANLNYTEPLNSKMQLMLTYAPSRNYNYADQRTNPYNSISDAYTQIDSSLSNTYKNTGTTQKAGLNWRYGSGKLNLMAGLHAQTTLLDGNQSFPYSLATNYTFNNVLPSAILDYKATKRSSFHLHYFTNTQLPSVTQLQNVINNNNTVQLSTGNPDLKQQYNHNIGGHFNTVSKSGTRTFFLMAMTNLSQDYIANSTFTASKDTVINGARLAQGSQLTRPVNMDGYRTFNSFMTLGFPLSFIRSTFNTNLGYSYTRLPGLINNVVNYSNSSTPSAGVTISSNISERFDFKLSYTANYNDVKNTVQTSSNQSYYSGVAAAKVTATPIRHLVLSSDASYTHYVGLSSDYYPQIFLWNAGIGYKFLKNDAAELKVSVYDILNQNKSLSRNVTNTYIEDVQTKILKRYFLLTFTYSLRQFKS